MSISSSQFEGVAESIQRMAGKIMMTISAWHDTSHTQLWKNFQYTQGGGEDIVVDETDSWLAHQVDDHLEVLSQCMAFKFPEEADKINNMARSIHSTLIAAYSTEPEDEDEISPLRSPEATQMLESEDEVRKAVTDKEERDADVPISESEAEIEAEMSRFTGPPGAYISVGIEAEMLQLDSTSGGYISDIMEEDVRMLFAIQVFEILTPSFQEPSFPLPFSLAMWGPSTQDEDRFLSNLKRQGITLTDNKQDKHSQSPVDSNMDYSDDNAEVHAPPFSWQVECKLFKSVYGFWSSAYFGALKKWLAKHYGQGTESKGTAARREEQEKELLQKGQEVLLICVDEFLENYMHFRIARYTKLASDTLEEASL
ncbi:hypothetical protein BDN71DRAFT_1434503 [Pleurotus eryngii]|uniref:Uncharacterized protein n=1 Tax=Pleurotus eryngii TaxID=5323 RepID=A0A9P6DBH5_PLEER|nr:hypothetical protein BDN71DRAFT_1434503 [Pleurotus eryngii]